MIQFHNYPSAKSWVIQLFLRLGYQVTKIERLIWGDNDFREILVKCEPYNMSSIERMYALYQATKYTVKNNIPGDFVECGVWKGGSAMIIALTLLKMGETTRKIYLYDTFAGMAKPTEEDRGNNDDFPAIIEWEKRRKENHSEWCYAPLEEVKRNMTLTGYPSKNLVFVKGKVEETIPKTKPTQISLLRLDTDWYESTKHELTHLFSLLSVGGVLIIDDYGWWAGAKKAVDEYFEKNNIPIFLSRIDDTCRLAIKTV